MIDLMISSLRSIRKLWLEVPVSEEDDEFFFFAELITRSNQVKILNPDSVKNKESKRFKFDVFLTPTGKRLLRQDSWLKIIADFFWYIQRHNYLELSEIMFNTVNWHESLLTLVKEYNNQYREDESTSFKLPIEKTFIRDLLHMCRCINSEMKHHKGLGF